jgi:GR25 family glycosyltransferase involved in LPS biosynthesis
MALTIFRAAAFAALCLLAAIGLFSAASFTAHLRAPSRANYQHGACLPTLAALEAGAGPAARWDPRAFPSFLVNGKASHHKRKWAESQLASIGYTEYTRVNGGNSSSVKENCLRCRVGVMLGHHRAWSKFLLTGALHGFFFEDDVVFHSNFVKAWPAYMALIPTNFSFLYVGQLSRRYRSEPAPTLVQTEVMPWGAHAYIVQRSTVEFLVAFVGYIMARAKQPIASKPFWVGPELDLVPTMQLAYFDVKNDFLLNGVFEHFFTDKPKSWFTFESTDASPALLHSQSWRSNDEIMIAGQPTGPTRITDATLGLWDTGVRCQSFLENATLQAQFSGKLPVLGTGLAFQNECEDDPFLLHALAGRAELASPPSCQLLRTLIRPSALSDATEDDCLDW